MRFSIYRSGIATADYRETISERFYQLGSEKSIQICLRVQILSAGQQVL